MNSNVPDQPAPAVRRLAQIDPQAVAALLRRYGLTLITLEANADIPGSYWGPPEAGLSVDGLYARTDTPLHSILHEAAHYICMSAERRDRLHENPAGDAGGDIAEEDAVCYLQILLADELAGAGFSRAQLMIDMDAWGYSFRLGSARRWFQEDADEALAWLQQRGIVSATGRLLPVAGQSAQ